MCEAQREEETLVALPRRAPAPAREALAATAVRGRPPSERSRQVACEREAVGDARHLRLALGRLRRLREDGAHPLVDAVAAAAGGQRHPDAVCEVALAALEESLHRR